jgi:hypothetical protein
MTVRTAAIRLGVEGKGEVVRDFADVGAAHEQAYSRGEAAAARATSAAAQLMAKAQAATVAARAQASAFESLNPTAMQAKVRAITGLDLGGGKDARDSARVIAEGLAAQERESARLAAAARMLRAEIDPLSAAQTRLSASLAEADLLAQRGVISTSELASASTLARQRYDAEAASIRTVTTAMQAQIAAAVGLGRSGGGSAQASAAVFMADEAAAASRAAALRAQIDPLGAAQVRLNAALAEADILAKRGVISTSELASASALARKRFDEETEALKRLARGQGTSRAAAAGRLNLMRQGADVFTTAAMGMNPTMIAIQQGPQILDALASSGFRIGAGMWAAGGAVTALGGALVLGTKAALDFEAGQSRASLAVKYLGAASGATVTEINAIAEAHAKSAGMSVNAARTLEIQLAKTGQIGVGQFGELIDLSRDFQAALGLDAAKANELLAASFAEPGKGAEALNKQLSFLDYTTLQQIKHLDEQGERLAAADLLHRKLKEAVAGAAGELTGMGKALQGTVSWFDDAWLAAGRFFDRLVHEAPAAEKIGDLRRLRQQQVERNAKFGRDSAKDPFVQSIDADVAKLRPKYDQEQAAAAERAKVAQFNQRSVKVGSAFESLSPHRAQITKLRADIDLMKSALDDPKLLASQKLTREEALKSIAAGEKQIVQLGKTKEHVDRHAEALKRDAAAMAANIAGQKALATAYLESGSAALIAEARRKASTEATRKGVDVEARVRAQLQLAIAEQMAQGAKQVADLRDQTTEQQAANAQVDAGVLSTEAANRALKLQVALRPLLTALVAADSQGLIANAAELRKVIAATRDWTAANDDAQAHAAANQGRAASRDRIADLQLEIRMAGDLTGKLEQQLSVRQALREAERGGYSGLDALRAQADAGLEAVMRQHKAKADYVAAQATSQRDAGELVAAELATVTLTAAQHDAIIVRLRTIQELRARNIDLESEEARQILAGADALEAQRAKLAVVQAGWQELTGAADQVVDDLGQALSPDHWGEWGDAGKAMLFDIAKEFQKLALLNPIKNFLTGGNAPTLSSVGGLFGTLFGGAGGGASAGSALSLGGSSGFIASLTAGLPGYAGGTDYHPGGWAMVGEAGPEIVNLPRGSGVKSNAATAALLRGQAANDSGGLVINMPITLNAPGADAAGLAALQAEVDALRRELPGKIISTVAVAQQRRVLGGGR